MIYLATALYCEAKPWIDFYSLKKDTSSKSFQIFSKEGLVLIITKTGKLNAALAINELFHHYPPSPTDFLINFGIAATRNPNIPLGSGYLCNKVTDADTFCSIYPDILYQHAFLEAALTTVSRPVTESEDRIIQEVAFTKNQEADKDKTQPWNRTVDLFDMEAIGVHTAALLQLQQHQICFYKVVSDHCLKENITPEQITKLLTPHIQKLMDYANQVIQIHANDISITFTKEEISLIETICEKLFLSVTMRYQFRQLLHYTKLCGKPLHTFLTSLLQQLQERPCTSKKEGKIQLERIRTELL